MKKARTERPTAPSRASLREMPGIDFARYRIRPNRFARRVAGEGIDVAHVGPSRSSLREIPEVDFSQAKIRRNPWARRFEAGGVSLQIGRRRPRLDEQVGPTVTRSVRLPPSVWAKLERRARARGVAVHALIRLAIAELLERAA